MQMRTKREKEQPNEILVQKKGASVVCHHDGNKTNDNQSISFIQKFNSTFISICFPDFYLQCGNLNCVFCVAHTRFVISAFLSMLNVDLLIVILFFVFYFIVRTNVCVFERIALKPYTLVTIGSDTRTNNMDWDVRRQGEEKKNKKPGWKDPKTIE